ARWRDMDRRGKADRRPRDRSGSRALEPGRALPPEKRQAPAPGLWLADGPGPANGRLWRLVLAGAALLPARHHTRRRRVGRSRGHGPGSTMAGFHGMARWERGTVHHPVRRPALKPA